jgi:hypothetical protein
MTWGLPVPPPQQQRQQHCCWHLQAPVAVGLVRLAAACLEMIWVLPLLLVLQPLQVQPCCLQVQQHLAVTLSCADQKAQKVLLLLLLLKHCC